MPEMDTTDDLLWGRHHTPRSANSDIDAIVSANRARKVSSLVASKTAGGGKGSSKGSSKSLSATEMARYGRHSYPLSVRVFEGMRHWGKCNNSADLREVTASFRDTFFNAELELEFAREQFAGENKNQDNSWERQARVEGARKLARVRDQERAGIEHYVGHSGWKHVAKGAVMSSIVERLPNTLSNYRSFYEEATQGLRYVVMDDRTLLNGFQKLLGKSQTDKHLKLGVQTEFNDQDRWCDYYVSYAMGASVDEFFAVLLQLSKRFEDKYGRLPRLWIDRFCLDCSDPGACTRALPCIMQCCSRLFIAHTEAYHRRLWCVAEMAMWGGMCARGRDPKVEMVDLGNGGHGDHNAPPPAGCAASKEPARQGPVGLDVEEALCGQEDDQPVLLEYLARMPNGLAAAGQFAARTLKYGFNFRDRCPPTY
jgi:hypothetical protein